MGPLTSIRPKWQNTVANKQLVKFKYADDGFDGSVAAAPWYSLHTFRGNGPFDPDVTGVGVQPYTWDQYTGLYDRCKAFGSKITVTWYAQPEAFTNFKIYLIPSREQTLSYVDPSDLMVTPYAKWRSVTWLGTARNSTLKHYSSVKRMYPSMTPKDDDFESTMVAVPEKQWYWNVFISTDSTDEVITVTFDVRITYYAMIARDNNIDES